MSNYLMLSCTFIVIGTGLNGLTIWIGSNFLCRFLDQHLILLLVALLAINTTTKSVVLTKMREIAEKKTDGDFSRTIKAMKLSTYEHITLIAMAVLLLVAKDSPIVLSYATYLEFIFNSLLVAVFAHAIHILYDTARSVYVILDSGF